MHAQSFDLSIALNSMLPVVPFLPVSLCRSARSVYPLRHILSIIPPRRTVFLLKRFSRSFL